MKFGTAGSSRRLDLPADPSYTYRSRIDIVEILATSVDHLHTYHYSDRSPVHAVNQGAKEQRACAVKDYSTGFHNSEWMAAGPRGPCT